MNVDHFKIPLLLADLLWISCGGGGDGQPASPAQPPRTPAPRGNPGFTFHQPGPHAHPLPNDPADEAQTLVASQGHRDGAAVFVYAAHGTSTCVLLGRRAPGLSSPGTWGIFMGSVEATDLDASGRRSYARAAEHEFYEETVSVYHQTDANALRACPTHMKHWDSGLRLRTFFSRQPHVPEEQFNQGYAYAVRQGLDKKFRENDQYLWVLLEDLRASVAARGQGFRDTAGAVHHLQLFPGFCNTLTSPGYVELMGRLP